MVRRSIAGLDPLADLPLVSCFRAARLGCCTAKTAVCVPSDSATSVGGASLGARWNRLSTRSSLGGRATKLSRPLSLNPPPSRHATGQTFIVTRLEHATYG